MLTIVAFVDRMGLAYPALSQAYSSSLQFTLTNEGQGNVPYFGLRLSNTAGQSAVRFSPPQCARTTTADSGVEQQLTFSGYARNKISGTPRFFNIAKDSSSTTFNTYWQIGGCELLSPLYLLKLDSCS